MTFSRRERMDRRTENLLNALHLLNVLHENQDDAPAVRLTLTRIEGRERIGHADLNLATLLELFNSVQIAVNVIGQHTGAPLPAERVERPVLRLVGGEDR